MSLGPDKLWLIPLLPLLSAAILSFTRSRSLANICSIGAMFGSFILSIFAFLGRSRRRTAPYSNFDWLTFGTSSLKLGFLLDPLTAAMLVDGDVCRPAYLYLFDRLHGA